MCVCVFDSMHVYACKKMCVRVCVFVYVEFAGSKGQHRSIESMGIKENYSLVPRLLPNFILQLWKKKIGRMPGTITTSQTGIGTLSFTMMLYATNLKQK